MPISSDEWEKGATSTSLKSRMEQFLLQKKGQAFTIEEMLHHLYQKGDAIAGQMGSALQAKKELDELKTEGKVNSKLVQTETGTREYYTHT